jgi:hypothetical protein
MIEPEKKITVLRRLMSAGRWIDAICYAAKFPRLGEHKARIMRAHNAYLRPGFYAELGFDIDELVADGIAALKERYPDPAPR